ncbi:MAG: hypothetical protein IKI46_08550 [Lachnospiraceae bacterium]|nr:hypothetical protein [Lachnospiraceae bacterium]
MHFLIRLRKGCKAELFIQRNSIGNSFYNYHFCDVQKSLNVQNKKRKELKDLFGEFITNYDQYYQIAKNLEIFAEDVDRYIVEKNDQKIDALDIEEKKTQLEQARTEAQPVPYPNIIYFPNEKLDIVNLNTEALENQRSELKKYGYSATKKILEKLINNITLQAQQHAVAEVMPYLINCDNSIKKALEAGLYNNKNTITKLENKYDELVKLSLTKETIFKDSDIIVALENEDFSRAFLENKKEIIILLGKEIESLKSDISNLTQNNKVIQMLSYLSANKQLLLEYRDNKTINSEYAKCPVCGSELFAKAPDSDILHEADLFIESNYGVVKEKELKINELQEEIDSLYEELIRRAKCVVDKEKMILLSQCNELNMIYSELKPYFERIRFLIKNKIIENVEEMNSALANSLLDQIKNKLLDENSVNSLENEYRNILKVLRYEYGDETIQQTYAKVSNLCNKSYDIFDFSYNIFVSKLNAIDSILANQTVINLEKKIENDINANQKLEMQISELNNLKIIADNRSKEIHNIVEELIRDEYEKVGPALTKYYNKLSRFNSSEGIRLVQVNEGISLVDDMNKNIVNLFSNGQISVLMLAHFFAGITARNDNEKVKIYFIDDLTSCMDDVNMLAFMDLLKYQMSSNNTIEQLFFITCDDRISELLKYKFSGRDIELCELNEADFLQEYAV